MSSARFSSVLIQIIVFLVFLLLKSKAALLKLKPNFTNYQYSVLDSVLTADWPNAT